MKAAYLLLSLLFVSFPALAADAQVARSASPSAAYGRLPLAFEPNHGQADAQVRFLARSSAYTLFLASDEAVLSLKNSTAERVDGLRMKLLRANSSAAIVGVDLLPGKTNYFLGSDPAKWRTGIPTYARVKCAGIYPGIDLVYYGHQGRLEYDFVVAPKADPTRIRMTFAGATLVIDNQGDLVLQIGGREVRFQKPVVYQNESDSRRRSVDGQYALTANQEVTFELGEYDKSRALIIDPTLVYSTYLGGSDNDGPFSIAVDPSGNAYITGGTESGDFPTTTGVVQKSFGGEKPSCNGVPQFVCGDAFVAKIDPTGTSLVYATYLGGDNRDSGSGIFVDATGIVYVAGETQSSNFPATAGVVQPRLAGTRNAFIAKLDATGSNLLYSTYLGGSSKDGAFAIAVDASGAAYITGATKSPNFPFTTGAFQTTCNSCSLPTPLPDAFVTKLKPDASGLIYSTFLGGTSQDAGLSLALDGSGNAYVTGSTVSTDFPTQNPLQPDFAGGGTNCPLQNDQIDAHIFICGDAFVAKVNPTGTGLVYSTYLGGSNDDSGFGIAVDSVGNAYVAGGTASTDFPTTAGVLQPTFGGGNSNCSNTGVACGDAFVAKINAAGSSLVYSTYLGGVNDDFGGRIAVDAVNDLHVTGITMSTNFPRTADASQSSFGGGSSSCTIGEVCGDGFLATLNIDASAAVFSTYLGGSGDDGGLAVASDGSGNDYVTGITVSPNFPTTAGAYDISCGTDGACNGGLSDVFVSKFAVPVPGVSLSPTSLNFLAQPIGLVSASKAVTLTNTGNGTLSVPLIAASGDYSQTNTCPATLIPGDNCSINVTFTPTVAGGISGEITVNDSAPSAHQMVNLSGTGVAAIGIAPGSLSFGTVSVGSTSAPKMVTLTNNQSGAALTLSFLASGNYSAVGSGTKPCGTSLAAKASCTMSVTFSPTTNDSINGAVTIKYNAAFSPQEVYLSGTGTGGAVAPLTLSPSSVTFASRAIGTRSPAQVVTVTNSSDSTLSITGAAASGDYTVAASGTSPCGGALTAGASCTVSVTFLPTSLGTIRGALVFNDTAAVGQQVLDVSGTGLLPVTFSPGSLTFAAQAVGTISTPQTVTLANHQNTALNITSIAASGNYAAVPGGPTPCGGSVAGKSTCTFIVTFNPTSTGTIQGAVTVTHNAGGNPQVVGLSGTGQ